jgi:hypothetical protein
MLKDVMWDMNDDPTTYEIRAAAQAMLGNFPAAQKDQKTALRMAQNWAGKPRRNSPSDGLRKANCVDRRLVRFLIR